MNIHNRLLPRHVVRGATAAIPTCRAALLHSPVFKFAVEPSQYLQRNLRDPSANTAAEISCEICSRRFITAFADAHLQILCFP